MSWPTGTPDTPQSPVVLRDDRPVLTHREQEVLVHLLRGARNQDVADAIGIGIETVKSHIGSLFKKFGVRSRGELIAIAYRTGVAAALDPDR